MKIFRTKDKSLARRKGITSILAGILLLLGGRQGTVGYIAEIINTSVEEGFISASLASTIESDLETLAIFGGITVIVGGLIYISLWKLPSFLPKFFISIGSGISVFNLFTTILLSSPTIELLILENEIFLVFQLGLIYLGYLLAALLALYSLVDDFNGLLLGFPAGTFITISLALMPMTMTMAVSHYIGNRYPMVNISAIAPFLSLIGILFYLAGFLYSYHFYKIGFWISLASLIIAVIPLILTLSSATTIMGRTLLSLFTFIGFFFGFAEMLYGYKKS